MNKIEAKLNIWDRIEQNNRKKSVKNRVEKQTNLINNVINW